MVFIRLLFLSILNIFFSQQSSNRVLIHDPDLCLKRPHNGIPEPIYFFPVIRSKLFNIGETHTFSSRCFQENIVELTEMSKDYIALTLNSKNKTSFWCSEVFLFHTSSLNSLQLFSGTGKHTVILKNVKQDDLDEIKENGIKIIGFCDGLGKTIQSIMTTLKTATGGLGLLSREVEKAALRILELFGHYAPERRNNTQLNINKKDIHSGDVIITLRMFGLDAMISLAGGRAGHSAICMWYEDELYVLEGQDGWYLPEKGIIKTKWDEWVDSAVRADMNVLLLPLSEEYRNKFDVNKGNDWVHNGILGLPFGYHNFFFSFYDTVDRNIPFIASKEMFEILISLINSLIPEAIDTLIGEAVNIRLNTTGLKFPQLVAEAARRGKTIEEILAQPEPEGVKYSDGYSYICSALAIGYLKHGNMFGNLTIYPNEFTVRDLYMLGIYEKDRTKLPQACQEADTLPYCQITGKFRVELDKFNTIKPYSHMNEHCPSEAPDFIRDEGC